MKYKSGQIIENVEAINLTYEAMGLVKINDYSIFVENLLPQEKADIKIKKSNNNFAFATVVKRYNNNPKRIEPKNAKLMLSGSTPLAILNYRDQLEFKENFVNYLFQRNIHFNEIKNIFPCEEQWNYRNKITVFAEYKDGKIVLGLYEKNTHNLVEQDSYDLANLPIKQVLKFISNNINNFKCFRENGKFLKQIVIRNSSAFDEVMIAFIISKPFELSSDLINNLTREFSNIKVILTDIQEKKNAVKHYLKSTNINDKIGDLIFKIDYNSFFQVNSYQTNNLYNLLIDNLELTKDYVVIDAYSGIGAISLKIASKVKKVYGLEIVKDAILNANDNAKLNNIKNVEFFVGDVLKTIDNIKEKIDLLILDPPRAGMSKDFLKKVLEIKPKQIGYISCNPHTLCRDVDLLTKQNYKLTYLKPCDMFCQTHHIETVAILELS
ncbi:23S rRNA (uracil(1939)-C(5))-methyltransferase RlmD [Mycoplasmopsis caviae]|uniref:23S rRNA (Uracil(1939)-C(5))-methyltransferase RlmD n=1 Tax=Mycoplasmopsis caviae TaxID=55603 RepID=A0A3P8KWQ1_9BACT|nr:23S rRNA (uracil(1939)-C(5))-methyltransferase RlmD [Mycoplasmopsis caviae]UUD35343.1 23S rRNA (uracil(1939)-C(5))-methyltransferase RlmD [Mycoplasmopsis caviae]VDR41877.1 tRNA (uracil-5-)-methyltransferase related enzyme [Mycoplasmopsis caviae]